MIYNLGSINADMFYQVPHLPGPGETIASTHFQKGLGGKGANMSVAAARAGAHVAHIGAVGADGKWAVERLLEYGVDTRQISSLTTATGHAIIVVDGQGENQITLFPGANANLKKDDVSAALANATAQDTLMVQNETNLQRYGAEIANRVGLRLIYAAAPFDPDAVSQVLSLIDVLVLNEVEANQLIEALGKDLTDLGIKDIIVTLGPNGCRHIGESGAQHYSGFKVEAVDATGAGDTFTGYLAAGLDRGMSMQQSIRQAQKAAAIMVTRHGTADVIPDLKDLEDFTL